MSFLQLGRIFPWWAAIICLGILYCTSRTAAFYIKYFFLLISYSLISLFTLPLMLLSPGNPDNVRIPGFFSRWFQAPLAGIRTTVLPERNYPPDQSFVVVCNHQSTFDSFAMMEAFPDNCAIIMKKHWLHLNPFGLAAILTGAIFIEKGNKNHGSRSDVLQGVVDSIHRKKCRVWFFPEGTRKLSNKVEEPMLPFKKGAFNIAVLAQIPVVPVVFSSQEKFFSYRDKIFKPGRIVVSILPPISTIKLTLEDVPQLTDKVRTMMIDEFKRISE